VVAQDPWTGYEILHLNREVQRSSRPPLKTRSPPPRAILLPGVRNGKPLLGQELTRYLAEGVQPDEAQFNLASLQSRRGASTLEAGEEEVVHDRGMPHLALLARLYHGVEATSCQSERNLSALSFLIAHLRSSMAPFKVEQMMFFCLNQDYIPEFRKYKAVVGSQKDSMNMCGREVQSMQLKTGEEIIEIDLR